MNILIIVTGGIAAYKSLDLVSQLMKKGYRVRVVMTKNAQKFVTPLSFQVLTKHEVYIDTFDEVDASSIQHIDLGKWADKVIVAPATANIIAKLANGIADDLASSLLLAVTPLSKVYVVPAMNTNMYEHPITQKNRQKLSELGMSVLEADTGVLACGDVGKGKFPKVERIIEEIFTSIDKNVLITAGPTKEFIDPFRCITNPSSGKMGVALAREFAKVGANVTLVTSVPILEHIPNITVVPIVSTQDMYEAVVSRFEQQDIIIKAAAVSDYTPIEVFDKKVKKQDGNITITFKRTPDILKYIGTHKKSHQIVVGFAAETHDLIQYASEKIDKKHLDMIVANDISKAGIGFGSDDNEVYLIDADKHVEKIEKVSKIEIAKKIVQRLLSMSSL
ncbi:bifunctional phosphopantothenoylcysteine decarboxylase/phosphopantothenate--cysteine ligase CoaBC [Carnobacteriaceae bacterium zg-84]|uniref:bifunctional phosphopantothenoylcysteine decarboxylase/phosphopantothenate--cysteine ligase CoaBC n=1 Tax=Granulicatella sp. zg-84 TaxID=2678503 RepID=UPI0013BEBB65|nr:bifunctional phosphopantothenoylcysteine decarboxylase/phosphopantothenate--cysteine ligase CoaBC [Granulicatella sp. zg-84]NEW66498.1 bifunctional phosphopantothenoylcysteine decarboxylase/phosphopantothenate--cysteine ligase CoaBC [Granulicatella sp. zg-84]QMI85513.1 bifunctional phosphopantothenoylcysteine decarboxylase/phosphopantothenate--cysteine ligase CoaBC [Carnobacteriaceae bacterium zg-84]